MTLRVRVLTGDAARFASLAAALRAADCAVDFAADGSEAPDADLVLVDPELPPGTLEEAERRHIAATLRHTRGNKRRAAHVLGIARSTLLAKVRRYGLDSVGHGVQEPTEGVAS
jgi:DNA-binding NtrC family response regulator